MWAYVYVLSHAARLIRIVVVLYVVENDNVPVYLVHDHERIEVYSPFSCEGSAEGFVVLRLLDDLFDFLHHSFVEDAVFFLELLRLFFKDWSKIRLVLHLL